MRGFFNIIDNYCFISTMLYYLLSQIHYWRRFMQALQTNDLLKDAIIYSTEAHKGAYRKGSTIPYILHPLEALLIVSKMTNDQELLAAAVLHDTVEDCKTISIENIEEKFGARVAALVAAESEDKSKTWKERKQHTIDFLQNEATLEVKMLTLGDKLSNMRSTYRDYFILGDALWERFNEKDPALIGWYYKSFITSLSALSNFPEYQEYVEKTTAVFGK